MQKEHLEVFPKRYPLLTLLPLLFFDFFFPRCLSRNRSLPLSFTSSASAMTCFCFKNILMKYQFWYWTNTKVETSVVRCKSSNKLFQFVVSQNLYCNSIWGLFFNKKTKNHFGRRQEKLNNLKLIQYSTVSKNSLCNMI